MAPAIKIVQRTEEAGSGSEDQDGGAERRDIEPLSPTVLNAKQKNDILTSNSWFPRTVTPPSSRASRTTPELFGPLATCRAEW